MKYHLISVINSPLYHVSLNNHISHILELSVIDSFTISIDGNETVAQMVMTVISGSLVIFTCNAFGIPEPELTWNVGTGSDYYTMSLVSSDTYHTIQTLSIDSVGLDDNGIYTCIATNRGGTASASTQLDVLGLILINNPHISMLWSFFC